MKKSILISSVCCVIVLIVTLFFIYNHKDEKEVIKSEYSYDQVKLINMNVFPSDKDYVLEIDINQNGDYKILARVNEEVVAEKSTELSSDEIDNIKNQIQTMKFKDMISISDNDLKMDKYKVSIYFSDGVFTIDKILSNDLNFKNLLNLIYNQNNENVKYINDELNKYYKTKETLEEKKSEDKKNKIENKNDNNYKNNKSNNKSNNKTNNEDKKGSNNTKPKKETDKYASCRGKHVFDWMTIDYSDFSSCMKAMDNYNDGISRSCYEVVDCTGATLGYMLDF